MDKFELFNHIDILIKKHVPYKEEPPYSIELGFNCFSWMSYLYNLAVPDTNLKLDSLRGLLGNFKKVKTNPQYLDVPLFYLETASTRHVGLMLDSTWMTQCSVSTNGISKVDITRSPWKNVLRHFYRHK